MWVSALKTGLQVYDPVAGSWVMGPIDVGGAPYFGDFSADGSLFVVPVQGNPDALVFVNTADGTVDQSLALPDEACELPHGALFTPDETRVLVVCEGNHVTAGTVAVVTTAPRAVEAYHTVGVFPDDLVWVEGQ